MGPVPVVARVIGEEAVPAMVPVDPRGTRRIGWTNRTVAVMVSIGVSSTGRLMATGWLKPVGQASHSRGGFRNRARCIKITRHGPMRMRQVRAISLGVLADCSYSRNPATEP